MADSEDARIYAAARELLKVQAAAADLTARGWRPGMCEPPAPETAECSRCVCTCGAR